MTIRRNGVLLATLVTLGGLSVATDARALKIYTGPQGKTPTTRTQDVANRLRVQIGGTATVNWGDCGGSIYCIDERTGVTLQAGMSKPLARKALASAIGALFVRWYLNDADRETFRQHKIVDDAGVVDAFQVCARSNPGASLGRWIHLYGVLADLGKDQLRTTGPAACAAIQQIITRGPNPTDPPAAHACEQIANGVYVLCPNSSYRPAWASAARTTNAPD